jgi:2-oxoglutarate ferredoxin oxidoreductase subunit gamma
MAEERIIISGFGGQGVLMTGRLLAQAGMMEGKHVTWLPSYGPEMRGGTANCHVILSEEIIGDPIVADASCVIAMNLPSLDKFEHAIQTDGWLLMNSSLIPRQSKRTDIRILSIPVNELAGRLGSPKVANVVMLGAYLQLSKAVQADSVTTAIREILGNKQHLLDINLHALNEGMEFASKEYKELLT